MPYPAQIFVSSSSYRNFSVLPRLLIWPESRTGTEKLEAHTRNEFIFSHLCIY
jgi:hypothetical protein